MTTPDEAARAEVRQIIRDEALSVLHPAATHHRALAEQYAVRIANASTDAVTAAWQRSQPVEAERELFQVVYLLAMQGGGSVSWTDRELAELPDDVEWSKEYDPITRTTTVHVRAALGGETESRE